jgi:hypothetical protein
MLAAIVVFCFAGGALARLAHEVRHAPHGVEGSEGLTLVKERNSARRRSRFQRAIIRFSGAGSGRPILFGRPG